MVQYEYESELVWDKDISDLEYVRELKIKTRKKEGIPQKYRDMYNVYGWTNLDLDAPTLDGYRTYCKRIFVIKNKDIGGPEHTNEFRTGSPVEAIEIDSIEIGKESENHNLSMDDIERIFGSI